MLGIHAEIVQLAKRDKEPTCSSLRMAVRLRILFSFVYISRFHLTRQDG